MNALLALLASALWGTSDFGGGLMSRRVHPSAAVLISQAFALALLLAVLPFQSVPGGGYLLLGAAAGVFGTLSLAAFYRAMVSAPLSLVAPITASGVCIPVLTGLLRGEHLHALQAAGMVVTLAGIVLASGPEWRSGVPVRRQALGYAIAASVGFGVAYTMLALAAGPISTARCWPSGSAGSRCSPRSWPSPGRCAASGSRSAAFRRWPRSGCRT